MDEKDKIIADQGTQIVLIHSELKSITAYIENVEKSLSVLGSMDKTIITQQSILESQERRLAQLERENAESHTFYHNMQTEFGNRIQGLKDQSRDDRYTGQQLVVQKLEELGRTFDKRFEEKELRVRALENWRWYILGIMAAAGLVLSGIPWKVVLGN